MFINNGVVILIMVNCEVCGRVITTVYHKLVGFHSRCYDMVKAKKLIRDTRHILQLHRQWNPDADHIKIQFFCLCHGWRDAQEDKENTCKFARC